MSYEIKFDLRGTYLYARIVGENRQEIIISYMQDIVAKCAETECFSVLIHECLEGPRMETLELFETVSETSKRVMGEFDAVAYVDEKMGDLRHFGESLAFNRGMPIAAFSDLDSATEWITGKAAVQGH